MKRFGIGSLVASGLAVVLAPFASAQSGPGVTGKGGDDRALSLQLSGDLDLQWRYLSSENTRALTGATADPRTLGSTKLHLRLDAALAEKASAVVELETPRISGGLVNTFGSGAAAGSHLQVGLRQANVKLEQLLSPDLNWTFGVQELTFDLLGKGNPLVLAVADSEGAWTGGTAAFGARDEVRPGGLRADWKSGAANLSFFHMIVTDVASIGENEYLTGADLMYKIDDKNMLEGVIALMNGAGGFAPTGPSLGDDSQIWLIGAGLASNGAFVPALDLHAQIYVNTGDFGSAVIAGSKESIDASGTCFELGGDYSIEGAWKPKVGLSFLSASGDDTDPSSADEYEGFVSYEDNDELVIIEDNEFGFDVDQNYQVIKIRGSITGELMTSAMKDSFTLEAVIGLASFDEDVGAGATATDDLGTEIDIKASWMVSKQTTVYAGLAFLSGADFIEDVAGAEDNSAMTFFFGTNLKF